MILAIGNSGQYEISAFAAVKDIIQSKGIEIISFRQDRCLKNEYMSFNSDYNGDKFTIIVDKNEYDIEIFKTIWYLKPMLPVKLVRYKPYEYAHFIQKQFETVRKGLWLLFEDRNWLNNPIAMNLAENKIFQLRKARQLGFTLPKTLISSNPKEIKNFHKGNNRTIVKSLSPTIIPDYLIFTTEITSEDLKDINSAKFAPAIYQELIEKAYELRITVVDGDIFAAKIYSQEDLTTSIDWRIHFKLNDYEVRMEPTQIPSWLEQLILKYLSALGLRFGCIDMIVTTNNEYIFLEVNPNGQWYFIQLNTGLEIAKSIARVLCQPY